MNLQDILKEETDIRLWAFKWSGNKVPPVAAVNWSPPKLKESNNYTGLTCSFFVLPPDGIERICVLRKLKAKDMIK